MATRNRLFSRRVGRQVAGLLVVGVAALALYYVFEYVEGRRQWRRVERLATERGEPLTIAGVTPGPVPTADNFAATEAWSRGPSRWVLPLSDTEDSQPSFGLWWGGERIPLDEWRTYLGTEDLLGALDPYSADLAAIAEAARLPHARFEVDYFQSVFDGMPYVPPLKSLSRMFALRAAARLERGENAPALADVLTVVRLVAVPREEPFLLTHLSANANAVVALQVVRDGLEREAWSEAELRELSAELGRLDLLGGGMHGLRAELAFSTVAMRQLAEDSRNAIGNITVGGFGTEFVHHVPSGWVYRNMARVGRFYLEDIFPAYDAERRTVDLHRLRNADLAAMQLSSQDPHTILARMFMRRVYAAIVNCAATQTQVELARIVCTLEIHRREHGVYPETLDALADTAELARLHDLVTGEPPIYRRRANDAFALYTTGGNRIDDGGAVAVTSEGNLDPFNGDWVWPVAVR